MVTPAGRHPFWRGIVLPRRREPRVAGAAPDALEPRLREGTWFKLAATGINDLKHVTSSDLRLGLYCRTPRGHAARRGLAGGRDDARRCRGRIGKAEGRERGCEDGVKE